MPREASVAGFSDKAGWKVTIHDITASNVHEIKKAVNAHRPRSERSK